MSRVRPQFRRVASRLLARPVVSENFEPRSIRDPCRLCGKIRSSPLPPFLELNPSSSLALSLFLSPLFRTPLCNPASDPQVPLPRFRTRGAHLPRQFPGSIKSRNSRFPPRRGAPSVVSLPVGRYYPGASRKFIVHGEKERKRKREGGRARARRLARAHTRIYTHRRGSRCMCHEAPLSPEETAATEVPRRGRPCE